MAAPFAPSQVDSHQWNSSPRARGRENARNNAKNILCRNVTIYGYCKHEKDGCLYNHDLNRGTDTPPLSQADSLKTRLNVDSPSFTPSLLPGASKPTGISPQAAGAAPFTPKAVKANVVQPDSLSRTHSSEWIDQEISEFVPQSYHHSDLSGDFSGQNIQTTDPFASYDGAAQYSSLENSALNAQVNPYSQESQNQGSSQYFRQQNDFNQPLQHHLYAPMGRNHNNLLPYQRTVHDFFLSENFRQDLQRKSEATQQILPNSTLPTTLEHFHSLVPLDTSNQKSSTAFGYNSWVYKAISSKDGHAYVLRRLEGFRLTSDKSIRSVQAWKRISNSSVVTFQDCFTTRAFGDSSLVFITDYYPLSKTLAENYFPGLSTFSRTRAPNSLASEAICWSFLVQIASALRTIHNNGLAARLISLNKILLTDKNRIRLNACGMLDVVQASDQATTSAAQIEDIRQLGRLILTLAAGNPNAASSPSKALEGISRSHSERFRATITALLEAGLEAYPTTLNINAFIESIADQAFAYFDSALHAEDTLSADLSRELENGRLVRLMTKLNFINERPEYSNPGDAQSQAWSEIGERYYLKLFRDFVFHQVTADGRPVVDLGHVIVCLNKLDAGSDEKIVLVSRDEQNVFIVSYKEVKRGLESAFGDLVKAGRR